MRERALRLLTLALLACLPHGGALAEPSAATDAMRVTLRIEASDPLPVGTTAHVEVFVRVPDGDAQPLLLTPASEGEAVRVVRGRLMRGDAQPAPDGELRFDVPVVVRSAGTAMLRVDVLTYHCEASCQPLRATATRVLHAAAR
jgi:hypothetical protein